MGERRNSFLDSVSHSLRSISILEGYCYHINSISYRNSPLWGVTKLIWTENPSHICLKTENKEPPNRMELHNKTMFEYFNLVCSRKYNVPNCHTAIPNWILSHPECSSNKTVFAPKYAIYILYICIIRIAYISDKCALHKLVGCLEFLCFCVYVMTMHDMYCNVWCNCIL